VREARSGEEAERFDAPVGENARERKRKKEAGEAREREERGALATGHTKVCAKP
jgi:hypothetical protein